MRSAVLIAAVLLAPAALAADITAARHDPRRDALVVDIAYRGTRPVCCEQLEQPRPGRSQPLIVRADY